jgi:hypothetical protein
MLQQYMGELGAHKDRHSILQPMWSQLHSEEQAIERLRAQLAARNSGRNNTTSGTFNVEPFPTSTSDSTPPPSKSSAPSFLTNLIDRKQETTKPADTGSKDLDRLINSYKGIKTPNRFSY